AILSFWLRSPPCSTRFPYTTLFRSSPELAASHLQELGRDYSQRSKSHARQPKAVNAIRKYNGREFSRRMVDVLDAGQISAGEFCRAVCLRRIKPKEINDFRAALQ